MSRNRRKNGLFGSLFGDQMEYFKRAPKGKITYHRSKKAERKKELKEERETLAELGLGKTKRARKTAKIVSSGRKSKPRKSDKELLGLFGDMEFDRMENPQILKKGVRGTVKLVGKGRNARLDIYV